MNCRQAERLLSHLLDTPLPQRQTARLQVHLETCAGCRRRQREFRTSGVELRRLLVIAAPGDLERRAVTRWSAGIGSGRSSLRRQHPCAVPALALAVVLAAAVRMGEGPHSRVEPSVESRTPRIAAEGPASGKIAAEAAAAYQRETAVVDARLARKVSLSVKGMALDELCSHLGSETGIQLVAGRSVADEKVTLFCRNLPLREVMRQLGRPFGYAWLRSSSSAGAAADERRKEYRYELVQDLRSQLMEEELRTRDRNESLLALDADMAKYREYLSFSPDQIQARLATARPEEKERLKELAGTHWGTTQMYFRLSPGDLAALRAGQEVVFSANPGPGEQLLPPDVARGVLQSYRDWRIRKQGDGGFELELEPAKMPDGLPPALVPEANARVRLKITQDELGQLALDGQSGILLKGRTSLINGDIASGVSPAVGNPQNAAANVKEKAEPRLQARVSVVPRPSCGTGASPPSPRIGRGGQGGEGRLPARSPKSAVGNSERKSELKVTIADVLEAIHHASGLPIVADHYTRLYAPDEVTVRNARLFDALNQVADTMRMRWRWDRADGWLQLRSASFFNDRVKEVPNRLLSRWAASHRQNGTLTLDDLVEVAQLTDAQLASDRMAEGARLCYGLEEWDLARNSTGLRPHLRFLAALAPGQRQQAQSPAGLSFAQMTLPQQQQFLALALGTIFGAGGISSDGRRGALASLEQFRNALLRVDYTVPGMYQWWVPSGTDRARWRTLVAGPVRGRSQEEALQAARKIDPQVPEGQIQSTKLRLMLVYTWSDPQAKQPPITVVRASPTGTQIYANDGRGSTSSGGTGSGDIFAE